MGSLEHWSRRFSFAPCIASPLPCRKGRRNNAGFFLIGVWKTFAFTLAWLGERWAPLSLYMWGLAYCVWCQGCLPSLLSTFVPCRPRTRGLFSALLSPSPLLQTHTRACSQKMAVLCTRDRIQEAGRKFRSKVLRGFWWECKRVLEHTCVNRHLVDSRWCSSILALLLSFVGAAFLDHYLSLALTRCSSSGPAWVCEKNKSGNEPISLEATSCDRMEEWVWLGDWHQATAARGRVTGDLFL